MALLVLAGLLAGCERSGGVRAPRWDADGRHVFYLERRLVSSIDTKESYHLYWAWPDLSDRARLAAPGRILTSPRLSSDGAWLLYHEGTTLLVLYDVRNRKEVRRIRDTDSSFHPPAWLPNATAFSFRDSRGIHLESVDGSIRRRLVPGEMYGLAWSRSGQLLAYTTGRGWPDGNELHVLDIRTNQDRMVASKRSGRISGALFTTDETRIIFVLELVDGRAESRLHVADLGRSGDAEIWRGTGTLHEEGLRWTKSSDRVLLATQNIQTPRRVTLQAVNLDGRARPLVEEDQVFGFSWDYQSDTDALIVTTPDRRGFKVIKVGQALGSR
jgi:dipeptidyl aminopeptidase/acylaminoacyl peptidase